MAWQEFNRANKIDKPKRGLYGAFILVFIVGFIIGLMVGSAS